MAFKGPLAADKGRRADDDPRERTDQDYRGRREIGSAAPPSCVWTRQAGLRVSKLTARAQSDSGHEGELFLCAMAPFATVIRTHDMNLGSMRSAVRRPSIIAIPGSGGLFAG